MNVDIEIIWIIELYGLIVYSVYFAYVYYDVTRNLLKQNGEKNAFKIPKCIFIIKLFLIIVLGIMYFIFERRYIEESDLDR